MEPPCPQCVVRRGSTRTSRTESCAVADRGEDAVVPVRIVFVPSIAPWNILATYVRVLRNRHRYHGTGLYHIAPTTVREMGLERVQRTLDNPQKRKGKDRARDMLRLVESMRTRGFDDSRPICVQLCRTGGRVDFLHQGHHRVAACLACGIKRMAVCFSAAGVWPHLLGGSGR